MGEPTTLVRASAGDILAFIMDVDAYRRCRGGSKILIPFRTAPRS